MSEKYTIARFTKDKAHFEILVKPDKALSYRMGKISGISDVLATDFIFVDANKGKKASEEQMKSVFETTNPHEIADIILKKGTLQLTTEQRHKMIDNKRKQIIDFISRQAVDPKTKLPHPPLRIENAMEEVRYPIDPYKSTEEQAREVVKLLRPILPLKIEQLTLSVVIPVQYAARAYGSIKSFGQIKKEEWRADGSWYGIIEMSAGVYASFLNKLGHITKGAGETKIIN